MAESDLKLSFCANCGSKLDGGVRFCPQCGAPAAGSPPAGSVAATPPVFTPGTGFGMMGMGAWASPSSPRFVLSVTGGMVMNSGRTYEAVADGEGVNVRIRLEGVAMKDAPVFRTDAAFFDRIEDIVKKNGVPGWDGFNGSDGSVMDGSGFVLDVRMRDGESVHAAGYMSYPPGYGAFYSGIAALFTELYETRFPNYTRVLDDYCEKELLPLYGDLTGGAQVGYGYVSRGGGRFSYSDAGLSGGVIAKLVGNFDSRDRDRASRDMAVFVLEKSVPEDGGAPKTALRAHFYTVDDSMKLEELGDVQLTDDLFSNDRLRARIFTKSGERGFYLGFYYHSVNRFWEKPDSIGLHVFAFDGGSVSVAFTKEISLDLLAPDLSGLDPVLEGLESLGFAATAEKWRADPSDPDLAPGDFTGCVLISTFSNMTGLYENLLGTPEGQTAPVNYVRGFIQPGM